ncbi:MAG: hypothetical protein JWP52_4451, partial [Rhizobacter sp.]|nr:hypothetical protein [Rhizobacter sp.]
MALSRRMLIDRVGASPLHVSMTHQPFESAQ